MDKPIKSLGQIIGCAGVSPSERTSAQRLALIFEVPMLMAAIWILMSWWASSIDNIELPATDIYDLLLWGLFFSETLVISLVVNDTALYLKTNWLNLVIVIVGLPVIFGWDIHIGALRLLRMIILFTLIFHVGGRLHKLLSRNELGTTLLSCAVVIIMAGIMMAAIEPTIKSPGEGIWWAWVTVSTVGYGDVVPVSGLGKIFGSLIILLGIALFSLLTGTLAAFFIERKEEEIHDTEKEELITYISLLDKRLDTLCEKVDQIQKNMEAEKTTKR